MNEFQKVTNNYLIFGTSLFPEWTSVSPTPTPTRSQVLPVATSEALC